MTARDRALGLLIVAFSVASCARSHTRELDGSVATRTLDSSRGVDSQSGFEEADGNREIDSPGPPRIASSSFYGGTDTRIAGTVADGVLIPLSLSVSGYRCTVVTANGESRCRPAISELPLFRGGDACELDLYKWTPSCRAPPIGAITRRGDDVFKVTAQEYAGRVFLGTGQCALTTRVATDRYFVLEPIAAPASGPPMTRHVLPLERVDAIEWRGSDGSSLVAEQLFDRTLGLSCNLDGTSSDQALCVPDGAIAAALQFGEATCTERVLVIGSADVRTHTIDPPIGCSTEASSRLVRRKLDAIPMRTQYWTREGGLCVPHTIQPGLRAHRLSDPLLVARWPMMRDALTERLHVKYVDLGGGVRFNFGMEDTRYGACVGESFADRIPRCVPVGNSAQSDNPLFGNGSCIGERLLGSTSTCAFPYVKVMNRVDEQSCYELTEVTMATLATGPVWRVQGDRCTAVGDGNVWTSSGPNLRDDLIRLTYGTY